MATDKPRFSITMDEETLERVEAFQKKHGIATKSKAVQILVETGLKEYKVKADGSKEPTAEERFIKAYSRLTQDRKEFLQAVIRALARLD